MAYSGHVALEGNVGYDEPHSELALSRAMGEIRPPCRKLVYLEVADSHDRRGGARLIGHTPAK